MPQESYLCELKQQSPSKKKSKQIIETDRKPYDNREYAIH